MVNKKAIIPQLLNRGKIEVELKAWADDLKSLRQRVEKIAQFKEEIKQEDIYFTFAHTQGYQKQRFRLRQIGKRSIVTVKLEGNAEPGIEANQEYEFEVSDPEAFKVFCHEFGFRVLIEKKKKVRKYLYFPSKKEFPLPITIELNQVQGLGDFIELETMVSKKNQVKKASLYLKSLLSQLGVSASKIEPRAYTELLYQRAHL